MPAAESSSPDLWAFMRLMLWGQGLAFRARMADVRKQSRLLLAVLGGFVAGYLGVGYWLFYAGLRYVYHFPLVGSLLSQRVLFLIFGFFFLMLVFSNLITGYAALFRNRETQWLLTLPVRHRHVYFWEFLGAMGVSSWAMLFLSLPLLLAYGQVHRAGWEYYVGVPLAILPFVAVPAVAGAWLVLLVVRVLARASVREIVLGAIMVVLLLVYLVRPVSEAQIGVEEEAISFERLLRHSRAVQNPWLPSSWMAETVLALTQRLGPQAWFYGLLLLSWALFGLWLAFRGAGHFFYGAWNRTAARRTERDSRKRRALSAPLATGSWLERLAALVPGVGRPARALAVKDVRLFWRDPAQWTQFALFFGLLCLYVANLRNIAFDFSSPFWALVISHLNLAACALTLSTLTTRFVFPQFSLEGRRLWILGLAPISLGRILLLKFALSFLASGAVTSILMIVSCHSLGLGFGRTAYFVSAILLASAALNGLSAGLGALFPNFREENPSKIVSGFGGTLCLVVSFVYIVLFLGALAAPAFLSHSAVKGGGGDTFAWLRVAGMGAATLLSVGACAIPLALALRKVKRLEI